MRLQGKWSGFVWSCLAVAGLATAVHAAPPAPKPETPVTSPKPTGHGIPPVGLKPALTQVIQSTDISPYHPGVLSSILDVSYTYDPHTQHLMLLSAKGDITVHAKDKAGADHLIQHEINSHLSALHHGAPGQTFILTHRQSTVKHNKHGRKSTSVTEECTFDVVPRKALK